MVSAADARRLLARRVWERRRAASDPVFLASFMSAIDQRDGSRFSFEHLREPLAAGEVVVEGRTVRPVGRSWRWQRLVAELVASEPRLDVLKGRQIGVTWVVLAVDVAEAVTMPGTVSLLFRQREDEAIDNVRRWWFLFQSLPPHFREGIRVVKPDVGRTPQPGRDGVSLLFPDGRISEVVPMTSAASSGHGRSTRRIIVDEAGYVEKLAEIRAAVEPAAGRAKINLVSTANGRSNAETGLGNEFHRVYVDSANGHSKLFLPYDVHPDRDEEWYASAPEVLSLKESQRHAQFPRDEHEAFALTSRVFFASEVLSDYRRRVRRPLYRMDFRELSAGEASVRRDAAGLVAVLVEPDASRTYAVGADCRGLRGADFNAAVVVDLSSRQIVAQLHGKLDADLYARQLHYLGRWYGSGSGCRRDALLAVEVGGGYGDATIVPLRDGRDGRPPYRNLYQHVLSTRPDLPEAKPYGFPMTSRTRPLVLNQLERALRERELEWVTDELLFEMESFVECESGTSPRAEEGSHDDLVMACAIALEMFRLRGEHPLRHRPSRTVARSRPPRPWQHDVSGGGPVPQWPVADTVSNGGRG